MKAVKYFVLGAAGIAALGAAAPAAAQYGYGYPYGYGNSTGNVIGQVLNTLLNPYGQFGYNRGVNPQIAVNQCASAVNQRLARYGSGYGYGGYGGYQSYGYGSYGNAYGGGQVVAITRVDQRSATTLRVRGLATSGMGYGNPYGGYGGYGGYGAYGAQSADLSFRCDVDYRGYIRDIDIDRRY